MGRQIGIETMIGLSMMTVIVTHIAHHPHSGVIHFDERRHTLGSAEPEHGHVGGHRDRIAVERHDPEDMPWQSKAADFAGAGI